MRLIFPAATMSFRKSSTPSLRYTPSYCDGLDTEWSMYTSKYPSDAVRSHCSLKMRFASSSVFTCQVGILSVKKKLSRGYLTRMSFRNLSLSPPW